MTTPTIAAHILGPFRVVIDKNRFVRDFRLANPLFKQVLGSRFIAKIAVAFKPRPPTLWAQKLSSSAVASH